MGEGNGTVVGATVTGLIGVAIGVTAVGPVVGFTAGIEVADATWEGSGDREQAIETRIKKSRKPYSGRNFTASVQRDVEIVEVYAPT